MPIASQLIDDNHFLLSVTGIDTLTEAWAEACINELKAQNAEIALVVLDFAKITKATPAALAIFARSAAEYKKANVKFAVVTNGEFAHLIAAQGLDGIFPCYSKLQEVMPSKPLKQYKSYTTEFLKKVMEAVSYTLKTTSGIEVSRGRSYIRKVGPRPEPEIAASTTVSCSKFKGILIMGFPMEPYLQVMSRFLKTEFDVLSERNSDGVAEFLNMIIGQARNSLRDREVQVSSSIPVIAYALKNTPLDVKTSTDRSIVFPFSCQFGEFYLEFASIPEVLNIGH